MIVNEFPDREIVINDKPYLYFGGTSYLGMSTHPVFQDRITQSIKKWGTSYGSSRNSNIKLSVYDKAEQLFSKQIGTEDSVSVSSGTLAGKLVLDYLSKFNHTFYHYPKTHTAILAHHSLPLFVNGKLHSNLLNSDCEDIIITVDAVLSLEVKPTSFNFLNEISPQKKITLVIDESHSLGLIGEKGNGVFSKIPDRNLCRKIMISSLGKALGLSGGIIAADKIFIDAIKNEPVFISSSGANPAYLEAYLLSQDLFKSQRQKLKDNLEFLFKGLELSEVFKYDINYPVIYCSEENFFDNLFKKGIIITSFNYPTYKGKMNRIVISVNHKQEDLIKLKRALQK
ncbi:MAG: aminotransferase class I/II-fold pyridoxal phosphate-dependent enzyme [Flavobacteriaceae bacterium]|nr:aminotransferase class I/II-fold pyridoxal phosphate-dependent enzyme [Flavobacteriaceae bacterium]